MRRILHYLSRKQWLMIGLIVSLIIVQVWLDLKIPELITRITALVQTPVSLVSDIWQTGAIMMLAAFGSLVSAIVIGFLAARIGARFAQRLRSLLFNQVESFSMQEINRFSTASLITRSTNDITQVLMIIVMGVQVLIKAPIMAVWAISKIYDQGREWTLVTAIGVLVVFVLVGLLILFVMPKVRRMQILTDNITRVMRENLTGLKVVRAYNAVAYQTAKFEAANEELTDTQLFTTRSMSLMMPVMSTMMGGISVVIYWIGARMIDSAAAADKLPIFSNMVVFSNYAMQVIMSFMMLSMIFIMYPRASVSASRINEVLDTEAEILDGPYREPVPGHEGEIEFRDVGFKYPDASEYVLCEISFQAKPGETVAFIGSTGSGKSTLLNLIPRFFDASEGEVLVGGRNVKDYTHRGLLNQMGYVPQRAVLFSGSVASNIAYGDNGRADFEFDIEQALSVAQAKDFVDKMDGGVDAPIARGGTNVSGGQKQRLSIARAIARKPDIYLFDDTFSALDYQTDAKLRSELKRVTGDVTTLIVAQRIGTIMGADQIIVLDEGRIVGRGKHRELLRDCRVYQEIAASQLSEEELAA